MCIRDSCRSATRARRSPAAAFALSLLLAWAGSCASIDVDAPRTPSLALADTDDTRLGREIQALPQVQAGQSGFDLIRDGIDALAVRLMMAERADLSLDVQYYLVHDDLTSQVIFRELLRAADRGVRVRFLLDDFLTVGLDEHLLAFDAHPQVEVRLVNPFAHRTLRFLDGAVDFRRINRRMHNKSFTADNQATVIGGRNLGDEYFAAREGSNFGDLDVLAVGPVVREVSALFDAYWNHSTAFPITAVVEPLEDPVAQLAALREHLDRNLERARESRYAQALTSTFLDLEGRPPGWLSWCPYRLVYDSPDKLLPGAAREAGTIYDALAETLERGREEVLIVSPYFVPLERGQQRLAALVGRGVRVRVITNSLAANNHTAVHSGDARARRPLLAAGVELYEARDDAAVAGTERSGVESSRATLHTKAFAVDDERLFLGSFNFDPRSAYTTTEMNDDTAYALTKTYWENKAAMAETAKWWAGVSPDYLGAMAGKLHPGALKYYDEKGIAVPDALR